MEASGSFHGRSEAQQLPRKLPRKEKLEAASTEFYGLLPWKLPQLPRNLSGFHDSSHEYICVVHYCASSTAYHFFDNMVYAHCVRDEGDFTVHWLLRFIGVGLYTI